MAEDYYSEKDGKNNFTFYTLPDGSRDNRFNSPNVEVGSIGVFGTKNPIGDEDGQEGGWPGHIWTVTKVTRDSKGNVTTIRIVEGHSNGNNPNFSDINASELQAYINGTGPFLGWGEMGENSVTNSLIVNEDIKESTCEKKTK